jgi:hypothetical protein
MGTRSRLTTRDPYSTIATTTNSGYVESGVPSGTTYYYVVSALNSNGETDNSSEVTPTPSAGITGYALGTFTATTTTQSFSVGIGYTTSQFIPVNTVKSQLNAIIVGAAD